MTTTTTIAPATVFSYEEFQDMCGKGQVATAHITYTHGHVDAFEIAQDGDAIAIGVNLCGILGAGMALQAKNLFPLFAKRYKEVCASGALRPGKILYHTKECGGKMLLAFPTKIAPQFDAFPYLIEQGLQNLVANAEQKEIKHLILPKLGYGLGKLKWEVVGPLMLSYLVKIPNVQCTICIGENDPEYHRLADGTLIIVEQPPIDDIA